MRNSLIAAVAATPAFAQGASDLPASAIWAGGVVAIVVIAAVFGWLLRARVRSEIEAIRKRERALEERYFDLVENANDVIYTHDLDGRITSMNRAGQAILGYSLADLKRMNIANLLGAGELAKARSQIDAKVSGAPRTAYELRLFGKDGQALIFEINSRLYHVDGVAVGVQGIARDITERKKTEEALKLSEGQLRASLEERERLARDLHDGIIQSIYAAGLNVDDCARIVTKDPAAVERRLHKVVGDLNAVIREVRNFIGGLASPKLGAEQFTAALNSLAATIGESQPTQVELNIDEKAAAQLQSDEATQLLNIAREALSNCVRHARAPKVVFKLGRSEKGIRFEVSDDGIGFDPAACEGRGFGLRNMATRARDLNADFQLESQTGKGTRIVLDIARKSSEQFVREDPVAHR